MLHLVAEFISPPPKVPTFSFIVVNIIPKSVKCIHSATKSWDLGSLSGLYRDTTRVQGLGSAWRIMGLIIQYG